jgi:hypothetical protein
MPRRAKRPPKDHSAQWGKGLTPLGIEPGAKIKSRDKDGDIYVVAPSGQILNTTRSRLNKKQRRKEREWQRQMKASTAELDQIGR